jgi:hypothetical protein
MMVLIEAWESCTTTREEKRLIKVVGDFVNSSVFGTVESKSQWKLPLSKEKELESSSFKAWQGRKVIDYLSAIMQHILSNNDQTRLRAWQSMVLKYLQVMRFAFQRQGRKVIDNFSAIMQHILSNNDQTRLRAW